MSTPPSESGRWFAEEVQPHETSLRRFLRGVFPSLPDIADLVQESSVSLIRARETGPGVGYAKAFLFTTARNAALDLFRRRRVVAIDGVANLAALAGAEDQPDAAEALNMALAESGLKRGDIDGLIVNGDINSEVTCELFGLQPTWQGTQPYPDVMISSRSWQSCPAPATRWR